MPSQDRFFIFWFFTERFFPKDDDTTISYVPDGVYDKIFFQDTEMGLKNGMMNEPISKLLKSVTPAKVSAQKRAENTGF
jgi:hypothetical protein